MVTAYTLVKGGSHITHVIKGKWKKDEVHDQPVDYRLVTTLKTVLLYDENDMYRGKEPILTSQNTSTWTKCQTEITGYDTLFHFKRHKSIQMKWSFEDHLDPNNKTYTWEVDGWEGYWKLKDDQEVLVAQFDRSGFSLKKQGVLTVNYEVPDYFLCLIIVSHKVVHKQLILEEACR